jgi:hypothetical protein
MEYTGSQTQKGVMSFALSANRQRPLAGTLNAAIFNTWRRFSHQVFFFAPPLIVAYVAMGWAIERLVSYIYTTAYISPYYEGFTNKNFAEMNTLTPRLVAWNMVRTNRDRIPSGI